MHLRFTLAACLAALAVFPLVSQIAVRRQGYVPFSEQPINYLADRVHDPVARLEQRMESGAIHLEFDSTHGYLPAVLKLLDIPVSSQTLVFSKTSFQFRKISPSAPRALYFNDDVYVGSVQGGKAIEIVSFDPMQGAIFYLLDEPKTTAARFKRAELDCTQCHVAAGTQGVPGVLLRSIYTNRSGTQATGAPSFVTSQNSDYAERWGGWYVTGKSGRHPSMANVLAADRDHPDRIDRAAGSNVSSLASHFDTSAYLSPESDIVAHLVLAHQTQMNNYITLTNYRTRLALYAAHGRLEKVDRAQFEQPAEALLRYLLFAGEASPGGRVGRGSRFAKEFSRRGLRDAKGRSLRDFDLRTRTFKYPCSYLIYSEAFDSIPALAKEYIYHRLYAILTGRDRSEDFRKLTAKDRRSVLQILVATKPDLPAEWRGGTYNK